MELPVNVEVVVIGGGQAGLSVSKHLVDRGVEHVVLDASAQIGDAWRSRWDSLRLFTPAGYDGLDGMPFPARKDSFPSKDDMADYLQHYVRRFRLPVISGRRVDRVTRTGDLFEVQCADATVRARQVVVAMSSYQTPRIPPFARLLAPSIRQLAAGEYLNPAQLVDGPVLIVGAGNSGAEIAKDVSGTHSVILAGANPGQVPFAPASFLSRHVVVHVLNRLVFTRILSVDTPIGRRARPGVISHGLPLIRVREKELHALGVERVGRVTRVRDGLPVVEDGVPGGGRPRGAAVVGGRAIEVANVVWCTGFSTGFSWLDLPAIDDDGEPVHERGIVPAVPGLYFVGLHFLTSMASAMVHGVGRDAERIAGVVAAHVGPAGAIGEIGPDAVRPDATRPVDAIRSVDAIRPVGAQIGAEVVNPAALGPSG